jgi:hypothetical protein
MEASTVQALSLSSLTSFLRTKDELYVLSCLFSLFVCAGALARQLLAHCAREEAHNGCHNEEQGEEGEEGQGEASRSAISRPLPM